MNVALINGRTKGDDMKFNFKKTTLSQITGIVAAVCLILGADQALAANQEPDLPTKKVTVTVSEVFVPGGFSSDSDVYTVASGFFPNGCYAWTTPEITNVTETLHEIRAKAEVTQGLCIMVLVPFNKEIRMGQFVPGEHTLRFMNGDGTYLEKKLVIE